MSGNSSLLVRGRTATYVLAGALVVALVAGALRPTMLQWTAPALVSLPWPVVGRFLFGFLFDLPTLFATLALCGLARFLFVLQPWLSALGLVGSLVVLDLVVVALIGQDFRLWTDPAVLTARVLSHGGLVLLAGLVLRPRKLVLSPPLPPVDDEPV